MKCSKVKPKASEMSIVAWAKTNKDVFKYTRKQFKRS